MKSHSLLLKALAPNMLTKTLQTFDRLTLWIVSMCWLVTIVILLCAIYTISLSSNAKKDAEAAIATEPRLPNIQHTPIVGKELQVMIDRLQRRYPDVTFQWHENALTIGGKDGGRYHQWLTAIGQIDTLYPQYHWKIKELCVGSGCTGTPYIMAVDVVGDKVSFELPQKDEKK